MEKIILILGLLALYFIYIRPIIENLEAKKIKKDEDYKNNKILTETNTLDAQNEFENKIKQHNSSYESVLYRKEIYIYKKIMLPWYNKICSDNRYKQDIINKIRKDWVNYMYHLDNIINTEYEINSVRITEAIEDAFASMVGEDAKKELEKIRMINDDSGFLTYFNSEGEKAPEGFIYDFQDNLIKDKRNK